MSPGFTGCHSPACCRERQNINKKMWNIVKLLLKMQLDEEIQWWFQGIGPPSLALRPLLRFLQLFNAFSLSVQFCECISSHASTPQISIGIKRRYKWRIGWKFTGGKNASPKCQLSCLGASSSVCDEAPVVRESNLTTVWMMLVVAQTAKWMSEPTSANVSTALSKKYTCRVKWTSFPSIGIRLRSICFCQKKC